MLKTNKGITLVALIITIIVLLILAGVSISMVIGENGIINRAQNSVNKYQNRVEAENTFLNDTQNTFQNYIDKVTTTNGY